MAEQDTVRLLRECDAGVKMGVSSIDDVLGFVRAKEFRQRLTECRSEHETLDREIRSLLARHREDGKAPSPVAKGMSWVKTTVKLALNESDETIADLMTDGCNMGVKTLNRYLNQYGAADKAAKDIAKRLIRSEETLAADIRPYL